MLKDFLWEVIPKCLMLELNIIFLVPKFDSIYNLFMPISVELNDLIDPLVTSV